MSTATSSSTLRHSRAAPVEPAGILLAQLKDPFALEVHRPVEPENAPEGLEVLPAYIPREHGARLAHIVG